MSEPESVKLIKLWDRRSQSNQMETGAEVVKVTSQMEPGAEGVNITSQMERGTEVIKVTNQI